MTKRWRVIFNMALIEFIEEMNNKMRARLPELAKLEPHGTAEIERLLREQDKQVEKRRHEISLQPPANPTVEEMEHARETVRKKHIRKFHRLGGYSQT